MRKIKCEFCGSYFDYAGQSVCPNCGGSLADNASVKRIIEEERMAAERAGQYSQFAQDMLQKNIHEQEKMSKVASIIFFVIFGIVAFFILAQFIGSFFLFSRFW